MIQCSPVPKIAIAKQMNGPFSERVKKKGRGHTFIFHTSTHTYKKTHTYKPKNTHTHTRTGRLPAFNIIHKERICNLLIIY